MSKLQFETLEVDNDYEIAVNHYPYIIRRKATKYVLKEVITRDGYHNLTLNNKTYWVHKIVAIQWIENDDPEHKIQVDHINHIPDDNRLENLRWITPSDNQKNTTRHNGVVYEFEEELGDQAFEVTEYNGHEFEDLWFDPESDCFYYYTGAQYREMHYEKTSACSLRIKVYDVNHVRTSISLSTFKKQHSL